MKTPLNKLFEKNVDLPYPGLYQGMGFSASGKQYHWCRDSLGHKPRKKFVFRFNNDKNIIRTIRRVEWILKLEETSKFYKAIARPSAKQPIKNAVIMEPTPFWLRHNRFSFLTALIKSSGCTAVPLFNHKTPEEMAQGLAQTPLGYFKYPWTLKFLKGYNRIRMRTDRAHDEGWKDFQCEYKDREKRMFHD